MMDEFLYNFFVGMGYGVLVLAAFTSLVVFTTFMDDDKEGWAVVPLLVAVAFIAAIVALATSGVWFI